MADLRAMEEQAERENIIDPREVTTEELLSGSGKHKHTLQDHLRHPFKGFGSADEARTAGRHLGEYLGKHHGQRYAEEFAGGCGEWVGGCGDYRGGALGDDEESGNVTQSGSYRGLGGATPSMGLSEVRGGGGIVGGASTRAIPSFSGPSAGRFLKGRCAQETSKLAAAEKAEQTAKTSGSGKPKRTNARAAVVKKVMADKGLSMNEASKYVKAHKLY